MNDLIFLLLGDELATICSRYRVNSENLLENCGKEIQ